MKKHARLAAVLAAACCSLAGAAAANAATPYVALGDSCSAGSGAGTNDLNASCYRSSKGYPQVVASQRTDLALTNVTCGGTVTSDVVKNQAAIKQAAPNATVVSMGYPHMFNNKTCAVTGSITLAEEADLSKVAHNLDAVIKDRSNAHGLSYVDAIGPFVGHDVCATSPWLWGVSNPWGPYAFYPNASGHASGYAVMVRSVIG